MWRCTCAPPQWPYPNLCVNDPVCMSAASSLYNWVDVACAGVPQACPPACYQTWSSVGGCAVAPLHCLCCLMLAGLRWARLDAAAWTPPAGCRRPPARQHQPWVQQGRRAGVQRLGTAGPHAREGAAKGMAAGARGHSMAPIAGGVRWLVFSAIPPPFAQVSQGCRYELVLFAATVHPYISGGFQPYGVLQMW